jgi:hypothetical protein
MLRFGIDISKYDGVKIDWDLAKTKLDFVFIKAYEYTQDSAFATNWNNSKGKVPRGAYYFWRQSTELINKTRTDAFLKAIGGKDYNGELPPVIDLEDTLANRALVFGQIDELSERIKNTIGRYPIIYTGLDYWKTTCQTKASKAWCDAHIFWFSLPNVDYSKTFEQDYLAIMAGTKLPQVPSVPNISTLKFLQWSYRGKPRDIPGYPTGFLDKKEIDFNFFLGTDAEFNKLVGTVEQIPSPIPYEITLEQKVSILWNEYLKSHPNN